MGLPSSRPVWRTTLSVGTTLMLAATGIAITAVPVRAAGTGPCDIYASGGTPCVAAHSTTRALFGSYNGALYQVRRWSDGGTTNVGVVGAGGVANAATQDNFCSGTYCTIVRIYDQTTRHNDLTIAPGGGANPTPDQGANAAALPVTAGGRKVYGVYISAGNGYRNNATNGVATGSQPEGMYMVTEGTHVNDRCCFDYGNAETNNQDTGNGDMDAIYFGNLCWFSPCSAGPRVAADLENGLFAGGDGSWTANTGRNSAFVTAVLKNNGTTTYAIKGGNADSGGLTTWYSGSLPTTSGYMPMHTEGAIILGVGGDNSNSAAGSFFEGVMTAGYPTDAADTSVQSNIVSVGYAAASGGSGATGTIVAGDNSAKCVDDNNGSGTPGTKVQMWDCDGNTAAQNWTVNSNGTLTIAGGCMDITGANSANGTLIELWTCNGGANQQWQAQSGELVNPATGKCLDDPASNTTNGTQLVLWTCNGGANQHWTLP